MWKSLIFKPIIQLSKLSIYCIMKSVKGDTQMRQIVKNAIYKHFKGNYYIVLDIAKSSENEEEYVVYRALYDDNQLWIRPLKMFLSEVDHEKYPNIKQKYRFELIKIDKR